MGDRLKRRKKGGEGAKDSAKANAPEPLQPKYFESEISGKVGEGAAETAAAPTSQEPTIERSAPEGSPAQRSTSSGHSAAERSEAERREKETQADFLLASRGTPELPLAAAVSGEGRRQNQIRPARRRRKRGGRGGGARRAPGAVGVPVASAAGGVAPAEAGDESSVGGDFGGALTPESMAGETAQVGAAKSAAPRSSVTSSSAASSSGAPAGVSATAPRPSKGTVVLAIGLPGSGKSSWFKRHDIHPLSSDLLRELLFDDAQEQRFQDLVFSNLRSMLKARLIARRPLNYVDATNLTPHDRHSWIKLAKDYGYDVQGLFFDVPLEVCLERHARRGRAVPEEIMRKMAGKLKPPTFEEGFSKITVVRVKQKDAAAG
ncbi:MAG: AAA family ATPase [Terriglobales bacterium]